MDLTLEVSLHRLHNIKATNLISKGPSTSVSSRMNYGCTLVADRFNKRTVAGLYCPIQYGVFSGNPKIPVRRYSMSKNKKRLTISTSNNGSDEVRLSSFSSSSLFSSKSDEEGIGKTDQNTTAASLARSKKKFIPRKAAVQLTEKARVLFQKLLRNQPTKDGILLNYTQSSSGEPRMVFSFSFVSKNELVDEDEGVSLEVDDDGNPKSPRDAIDDGLPKLYVHHNAFLKVLGATIDVDETNVTPILYDKEGHEMDANV